MSKYEIKTDKHYDTHSKGFEMTGQQLHAVANALSEYFGCFKIYAYTFTGHPVTIQKGDSMMECNSVRSLIRDDIEERLSDILPDLLMEEEEEDDEGEEG